MRWGRGVGQRAFPTGYIGHYYCINVGNKTAEDAERSLDPRDITGVQPSYSA